MDATTRANEIRRLNAELKAVRAGLAELVAGAQIVQIGDMSYSAVQYFRLQTRELDCEKRIARLDGSRPAILPVNLTGVSR